jgi:hypothetical protein
MSKTIKVDEFGHVFLWDLRDLLDVRKIVYYSLKVNKNKTLSLKFYDKKKKLVRPYGQK